MGHHSAFAGALAGAALIAAGAVYLRRWMVVRRDRPGDGSAKRLVLFLSGLIVLWIASCSPLAMLDEALLTAHMVQHLLIMLAAAPLLLMGLPGAMRPGVPGGTGAGPGSFWPGVGRMVTHPAVCWLAATLTVLAWHVPAIFAVARGSGAWHLFEHASFLAAGILFWWPVIGPRPLAPVWPQWSMPLYLFFATLPCDALSAFLAFSGRVLYSNYLTAPRRFPLSPLQDQECAGALMWTAVTFAYLAPAAAITVRLLSAPPAQGAAAPVYTPAASLSGSRGAPSSKLENTER
jgi:putative membrane protein